VIVTPRPATSRSTPRRWPRRALALLGLLLVAALVVPVWLDRSTEERLTFGRPGGVVVTNRSGPVEVREGAGEVVVEVVTAHLFGGPEVVTGRDGERVTVDAGCEGSGPCRITLRVTVPPGTAVEAVSPDDTVAVGPFTGPLTAASDDGRVVLGPVTGPVRVRVGSASLRATDLRSTDVSVESGTGPLDLVFTVVPRPLVVAAGTGPVEVTVPAATYRLALEGAPLDDGGLEDARRADGELRVSGAGLVRLRVAGDDEG
jgi:hypothetical protein